MRVSLCGILLLPICAAFTSLDCVHKCLTDPILALLPSEDEIRGMAQRGMDGDFSLPREYRNMTEHQLACSVLNEVVPCLEECDAREPSNQQAYFKQTLGNLHRVVCSTPETFFQYALPLWSEVVQCYEGQLSEDYALTVFGALMVSGGVEGVNEDTNLCYVASSVARVLVNNNCNRDVKRVVVSAVEFLYRFAALKLGMHNVPTTDQPGLDGTCEDFSYFVGEVQAMFEQCPINPNETKHGLSVLRRMVTSGGKSWMSNRQNLCDMHRSLADPSLLEFESRLAEIEDPLAKHKCKLAHKAFVDIATVPLRLAALKLGIDEEGFRCGPY